MAYLQPGRRGGVVLVHNGYRYQRNKTTVDKIHWRCWRKPCRQFLITDLFEVNMDANPRINVTQFAEHTHERDETTIDKGEIMARMKDMISHNPTLTLKRVYNEATLDIGDTYIPPYVTLKSELSRFRARMLPPIPADIDDVDIRGEWQMTWEGDQFLSHLSNDWGIVIFATEDNIRRLSRSTTVYIDGTFWSTPRPFRQFVTVHGQYMGRVQPLAFVLMAGSTTGEYRQVLQHIKQCVRNRTGHRWRPRQVITDFEISLLNAIEIELPRATSRACYFHFCQSLWRRIQELNLSGPYRRHQRVRRCVRKFLAIGYLPLALVRINFRMHVRASARLIHRYPALNDWIVYIERNYLDPNGNFPPMMWNVYTRDHKDRTNNVVEGFHNKWNNAVGVAHPSLWVFIRKLKDQQRQLDVEGNQILRGDPAPPIRRKWRELERRVHRLKEQYRTGARTLDEYWDAITHCITRFL